MAPAADAGTITLGDLTVTRLGYGAMRITGPGTWGDRPDPKVPIEESVGALKELQDEGKIRHIGVSNVTVDLLRRSQSVAPIVSVQNQYNVGDRASEDVLEVCETEGLAFLPWHPLSAGALAQTGGQLDEVAHKHDATPVQVALAWLLHRSPAILVIPG